MREIVVREESFADEEQLCSYIASQLALDNPAEFESFDGGLGELIARLSDITHPTRIVLRHESLDDPVAEVEGLATISEVSRGEEHDLDWFDVACALLERADDFIEPLDVIVYYDDLGDDEPNEMPTNITIAARAAISRLKQGNVDYLTARRDDRNISSGRIRELFEGGQHPYAVVITCADSRVVPEHLFMAGLGELFVIRVAGNVVGDIELASAVYACEHLHSKLLLVLGHTHCGAIESAMAGEAHGPVAAVTSRIAECIGDERDPYVASVLNVRAAIETLAANDELHHLVSEDGLEIHGAIYHTHSGVVDFLDECIRA
ncbi:MAG: hypothetical protein IKV48_01280 [Eggerthellaceae bacterium]|nr:hypothetical protein [Eggerthellaceae bacterium]